MDCSICCEKFNKSTHFKIQCKTCEDTTITSCRMCCKKFLIDNSITPKCMICKIEWDKEFLFDNFTKVFINKELKEIKENVLLDMEISKLPDTQEYAEGLKMIRGLEKQKQLLYIEETNLNKKLNNIRKNINDIDDSIFYLHRDINTGVKTTKKEFNCKCPVDNCKGFLDTKYNCGICENTICKICMEIKNDDHECDEDKIETIKLLKKDTKGCPKCGQLIYKIDGCDQMWCPPCHTTFSWRTGMVETGTVHNPEYYRWMRENNITLARNPGDQPPNPCGDELMGPNALLTITRKCFPYKVSSVNRIIDSVETITISNMHRMVRHIDLLIRRYNNDERDMQQKLKNYRAFYLLDELDKITWKSKLQILDKKMEKSKNLMNIWNLLRLVIIEYIGKIQENRYSNDLSEIITKIINEGKETIIYCNKAFERIGKIFTGIYPGITNEWIQIDNYKKHLSDFEKLRIKRL